MSEIERKTGLEDIESMGDEIALDVPDNVYVSRKGKMYYPAWSKQATIEISIDAAHKRGYKPSRAYQKFVEEVYEKQLMSQREPS